MKQKLLIKLSSTALFLAILLGGGRAFAATRTWVGGGSDTNFSTTGNWAGGVAPSNGDDLVLPSQSSASTTAVNDSLTSVGSITLSDGTGGGSFSIADDGTPSTLAIGGTITVGTNQSLNLDQSLSIGGDTLITLNSKDSLLDIDGPTLDLSSHGLIVEFAHVADLTGDSLSGDLPQVYIGTGTSGLTGTTGTSISFNGVGVNWDETGTTYPGQVNANKSVIRFQEDSHFGDTTAGLVLLDSQLRLTGSVDTVLTEPVTFKHNLFGLVTNVPIGEEAVGNPAHKLTLAGAVVLQSDVEFDPFSANIEVTGPLSGAFLIGGSQVYTVAADKGHIIINSSANTSLLPNGDYVIIDEGTITDDQSAQAVIVQSGDVVVMNGKRGKVIVSPGATLKGKGVVGDLSVLGTATLAPGESPGCLTTGALALSPGAIYQAELNGNTQCTEYDTVSVNGAVSLSGAILDLQKLATFKPVAGKVFTIIDNDGSDAVTGEFAGHVEGATITVGTINFKISYKGGTGNDVTLTVLGAVPDTGARMLTIAPFAVLFIAAGAVSSIYMSKRTQKSHVKKSR